MTTSRWRAFVELKFSSSSFSQRRDGLPEVEQVLLPGHPICQPAIQLIQSTIANLKKKFVQ
jgi:hypothetical protein